MKIVCIDNFARGTVDDILVCEKIDEYWGNWVVRVMNNYGGGVNSRDYFILVSDDYELYKAEI